MGLEVDVARLPIPPLSSPQLSPMAASSAVHPLRAGGPHLSPTLLASNPIATGVVVPGLIAPLNRRHTSGSICQPLSEMEESAAAAAAVAEALRSQSLSPPLRKAAQSAVPPRAMPVYARRSTTSISSNAGAAAAGIASHRHGLPLQAPAGNIRPGTTSVAAAPAALPDRTASSPTARRDSAIAFAREFREIPSSDLEAAAAVAVAAGGPPVYGLLRVGMALRGGRPGTTTIRERPMSLVAQVMLFLLLC
jgi:hypothetical protein